jgi:two-component sensor histidine kinase
VLLREDPANNRAVLAWVEKYFRAITLTIAKLKIRFNPNGIRFSLLFAILSEIIYNAFKYSTGVNPIQVSWTKQDKGYMFACRNDFSERSTERTGSQKGLVFISSLTRIIEGVEFAHRTEDNMFIVELQFEHGSL